MKSKAFVAEFVGTFALIFVGTLVSATTNDQVGIALAHGFIIAAMVTATAAASGGHLNPAVTFGLWIGRRITLKRLVGYWGAQLLGAFVGAYAAFTCLPYRMGYGGRTLDASYGLPSVPGRLMPPDGGLPVQAILVETVFTFFLVYVVLGTAVDRKAPKVGGLYIGLAVALGVLAAGPLTGGSMNPARWFGPALLVKLQGAPGFLNWPVYIIGPLLGATVASYAYGRIADDPTD